mgnify:FL=1
MMFKERVKRIARSSWKALVVASVIIGLFAAWNQLTEKTSLFSQIISQVNVLDVHDPLKGLDLKILFGGEDVQEKNLNLRIYTVSILPS